MCEIAIKELEYDFVVGNFSGCKSSFTVDKSEETFGGELRSLLNYVANCQFEQAFLKPTTDFGISLSLPENAHKFEEFLVTFQNSDSIPEPERSFTSLLLGICALQEFVRLNFCGPPSLKEAEDNKCLSHLNVDKKDVLSILSVEGECISLNTRNPELLCLAYIFIQNAKSNFLVTQKWWLLRCVMIHQKLLPERIFSLHDRVSRLIRDLKKDGSVLKVPSAAILLNIECAMFHLYFQEVSKAEQYIQETQDIVGLKVELSGAYGKRTHFQQKSIPQLLVQLKRISSDFQSSQAVTDVSSFPQDLRLQDDTVLNQIAYADNSDTGIRNTTDLEQLLLLTICLNMKRKNPAGANDELVAEELMSYIDCLLQAPTVWSVKMKALLLRCAAEKKSSRRMDRSLRQLEELKSALHRELPPFSTRQHMLWSVDFPPAWLLDKELADLLMQCACYKSALAIYLEIQSWDDVVSCYLLLDMKSDVVKFVEERLKVDGETTALLCLMGDATDDPSFYERAIQKSDGRNARSLRSMGFYYFKRKDYKGCLSYFEKSLDVNYLQPQVWFSLGYAATQCEDYQLAAKAYRQLTDLEPDNFEAWNNLANAYIRLGQKTRAWSCLQDALRLNFEEWRVWENFLLVSADIRAFEDVLRAYHRIMDIKQKHLDVPVLRILVKAINENLKDSNGVECSRLRKRVQELFGRITSITATDSEVWELYSKLQYDSDSKESLEKALHFQQKALNYSVNKNWSSNFASIKNVLATSLWYSQLSLSYLKAANDGPAKQQQKTLCTVSLRNLLTRVEKVLQDFSANSEQQEINEVLASVQDNLKLIYSL